jgi:hypothetical protein
MLSIFSQKKLKQTNVPYYSTQVCILAKSPCKACASYWFIPCSDSDVCSVVLPFYAQTNQCYMKVQQYKVRGNLNRLIDVFLPSPLPTCFLRLEGGWILDFFSTPLSWVPGCGFLFSGPVASPFLSFFVLPLLTWFMWCDTLITQSGWGS